MRSNRFQFGLTLLTALFFLAVFFAVVLYLVTPEAPASGGPILLAAFIAILLGILLGTVFLLRWIFRPYRQLVGEAERASVGAQIRQSSDEAEFVLDTFQSVVGQLQEQRKELEKLSAAASERATSAEKFSERIVASLPSALIAFDGNGLSMAINGPGRALLEVDGTALGQPYQLLFGNCEELASTVADCLENGTLYRRKEVEAIFGDGQIRRIGATIAPVDPPQDRGPRGALCLLTDVTEVSKLREQVALKNNLENLGEMSAGLAHEFKNTIAALHGYVQLLQNQELNERARVAADSLLNEVRNLSDMVTAFLNFARPQPLQPEEVSVNELVQECAVELRGLFEELHVTLSIDATDPPAVRADERMLRQALLNLLRNAAEAIPSNAPLRKVSVSVFSESDRGKTAWAVIETKDSGSGIPEAQLQKIFIPFFTTKARGHGVGLALAHRVITQHGGSLTATNAPEGGAIFTVRLPHELSGNRE
ncbi:MAG: PAS domain-containing sensor histidine kinase [Pyrinomonadaceae bacterium]